jgi:hypothetical protein
MGRPQSEVQYLGNVVEPRSREREYIHVVYVILMVVVHGL